MGAFRKVRRGFVLGFSIVCFAARAGATPRVELRWRAAEGCIDEATLAATVERTLDQPVFHGQNAIAATLDGDLAKSETGWAAKIVLRGVEDDKVVAERTIGTTSDDCSRLDDSIAVVVAMMVDGVREQATPAPLRVPPAPPRVSSRAPSSITGHVEAGAALAVGLLPDASAGAYVHADVASRRWSIGLTGYGWSASNAMALGSGARISAWTGTVEACGAPLSTTRFALHACVALGAGFTDATPIALSGGSEQRLPIMFDGVTLGFDVRIAGPVWLRSRASLWNPFVVPSYYFQSADGARHDLPGPWVIDPVFSIGLAARIGS